jgi:hypothetical protein
MKIINPKLEVLDWGLLNFEQAFYILLYIGTGLMGDACSPNFLSLI